MSQPARATFSVEFLGSLAEIDAHSWDRVADTDYPFLSHAFLWGLEQTGCTTAKSGWQPCHALLRRDRELVGIMPLYLKSHSYGEYVFDWSWADAWERTGRHYYPKLVTAIPFTPATGPRLCVLPELEVADAYALVVVAIKKLAQQRQLSSWHLLFPEAAISTMLQQQGLPRRVATQFHWFNEGYTSFEDFLARCSSRKRKNLRRERSRVAEQGLRLQTFSGDQITAQHWLQFHRFYQLTYAKRSGHGGYLTREFFTSTAAAMGAQVIMVLAYLDQQAVAGALYFRSGDTLFGRYWGCEQEFDCLHFEACYYQGIEYCIRHGLQRFDPGAQGEHKIQRGFRPVPTYSNHWIADPDLAAAVAEFTLREEVEVARYRAEAATLLPFRQDQ